MTVEIAEQRVHYEHIPEKSLQFLRRNQLLFANRRHNRRKLCAVSILFTVNTGIFQLCKFNQLLSVIREITAGNHRFFFPTPVRISAENRFLRPQSKHFIDMTGKIFADAAVCVAHGFAPSGHWRGFQHIAFFLILNMDFIPICAAICLEFIDFAWRKINHPPPPLLRTDIFYADNLPALL